MSLSLRQINILVAVERSMASISVLSTTILLTTYCTFKRFRSLSNTLIFYASFANLFANVACLMGRDYIHNPDGAMCQFQAFLLEMFMQSDPLWSCAMAINVYLCIFRRYDPTRLRKMHWKYGVFCYGVPFLPAMFCLFYRDHRGKMYGDATLWCWIDQKWSDVRIYSYYLPIWISILISLAIYVRVGIVIYKVRADIRALERSGEYTLSETAASAEETTRKPSSNTLISPTETRKESDSQTTDQSRESGTLHDEGQVEEEEEEEDDDDDDDEDDGISRWDSADVTSTHRPPPSSYFNHYKLSPTDEESPMPSTRLPSYATCHTTSPLSPLDPTYTHPSRLSRPSISSMSPSITDSTFPHDGRPHPNNDSNSNSNSNNTNSSRHRMDKLKWAYTKSALLFTVSILITWIPASINRAQGLRHPHNPSFVLSVMSAAVLPLQGFWNTVIFFAGSWGVVKRGWRRWVRRRRVLRRRMNAARAARARLEREKNVDVEKQRDGGEIVESEKTGGEHNHEEVEIEERRDSSKTLVDGVTSK